MPRSLGELERRRDLSTEKQLVWCGILGLDEGVKLTHGLLT